LQTVLPELDVPWWGLHAPDVPDEELQQCSQNIGNEDLILVNLLNLHCGYYNVYNEFSRTIQTIPTPDLVVNSRWS